MNKGTITLSKNVLVMMVTVSLLLTGCANRSPISQLRAEDELSFHLKQSKYSKEAVKLTNEELGKTTAEMGGGGAIAGAAVGVGCGPWVFICAPLGMIVGGVVGGTVGFIAGASSELDSTTRTTIAEKMTNALREQDLDSSILTSIKNRSSDVFIVKDDKALNHVTLNLEKVRLKSYDEGVSLVIVIKAELEFLNEYEKVVTKIDKITYDSTPININSWVMADDKFYQQLFSSASYYFSEQIVYNLLKEQKQTLNIASL